MARDIKKILISTMPRSGTRFVFDFVAELFGYRKLEPEFTAGLYPIPPEWDPYKFDRTYRSLENGQVLCAHYPLSEDIKKIVSQPDVLSIYLYRDPRDAAVSAVFLIKNVATRHPLHNLFRELSDADAMAFILSGGILSTKNKTHAECNYINHEGMKYFCDIALEWLAEPNVAKIRYEEFVRDPASCLKTALQKVDVEINEMRACDVADRLNFSTFSKGRERGVEDVKSHYRKGISGDHINHFSELHKAICKQRIGHHLIELGYETNLCW